MENASKALLIAGAVLIVILLISVGIMIFNSSKGLFGSATASMSEQEQKMFNDKFTMYEGNNVSGTQLQELIRAVKTSNMNDDNPQITIKNAKITANTDATVMPGTSATIIKTTDRYIVKCTVNEKTGLVENIEVQKKS